MPGSTISLSLFVKYLHGSFWYGIVPNSRNEFLSGVEWLRRRGHSVVATRSSFWYNIAPGIYQAFPYHWQIQPAKDEIRQALGSTRSIALRYSTPVSAAEGIISYHVVLDNPNYHEMLLGKKARYDVRRGRENGEIEPITMREMAVQGWEARMDTLKRQHRESAETMRQWHVLCESAEDLPGFEAWGIRRNGKLVTSLLAYITPTCAAILYQQSLSDYLKARVNNALTFTFSRDILVQRKIPQIFYGLHSLDAPPSIDEFKFRMGYTVRPVRQRIVFQPLIAPLMNRASYKTVSGLLHLMPQSPILSKAEGVLRFYLQGKQDLHSQTLPQAFSHKTNPGYSTNYGR